MKSEHKIPVLILVIFILGFLFKLSVGDKYSQVALVNSPYLYNFNVPGILNESGSMAESRSQYWWLNSGGVMNILNGAGSTNKGELASLSKWRLMYRVSNPSDTDQGFHPQNIFRMVSRNVWQDASVQAYFRIIKDNLSESSNRNISNGVLLMSRYQDQNNLYYAGIRVDGTLVIKKKRDGEYLTLAQKKIFESDYDRDNNPNLIPKNEWFGIKCEIENLRNSVKLSLYTDFENTGTWKLQLKAEDDLETTGSPPISDQGFVGIRTDFMDVEFKDFLVQEI